MLQKKREELIKSKRRDIIRRTLTARRETELLKIDLKSLLGEYQKCALVTGQQEHLGHNSYIDCETFVFDCQDKLSQLLIEIGVEEAKTILVDRQFSKLLYEVMKTIENKTLELDEVMSQIHFQSRNLVLSSAAELVSLLSEDEELIEPFEGDASHFLINQLTKKISSSQIFQREEYTAMLGLINLFRMQTHKDMVYEQLCNSNFQFFAQRFLVKLMAKSQIVLNKYKSTLIVTLLLEFLEYQQKNTTKIVNPVVQKIIAKFAIETINKNIQQDQKEGEIVMDNELIDELLEILIYVHSQTGQEREVLTNEKIFKKMNYVKLLNHYSYHHGQEVSLELFQDRQLRELLQCAKELQNSQLFEKYLEYLASGLLNLLQSAKKIEQQTKRLWKILQESKSFYLFFESRHQNESLNLLVKLLDLYPEQIQL